MSGPTILKGVAAVAATAGLAKYIDERLNFTNDYNAIKGAQANLAQIASYARADKSSCCERFIETAARIPDGIALIFEGRELTWKELDLLSNQFANWLVGRGVKAGDMIALCFENSIEMYIAFLGTMKAGAISALMNHNLRLNAFVHCFRLAKSSLLIFQSDLGPQIMDPINDQLAESGSLFQFDLDRNWSHGYDKLDLNGVDSGDYCEDRRRAVKMGDPMTLIFTSGTTGLPKAATVIQNRYNRTGYQGKARGYTEKDRWYCALPLFHSAAQIGLHTSWSTGMVLILARKFSATGFWPDCHKYGATIIQYIGELARYLLMVPPRPTDRGHKVRVAFGNGLRADIWLDFKKRFGIEEIQEFYGATEATFSTLNRHYGLSSTGVGACGRVGPYFRRMIGTPKIVKFDVLEEKILRGKDGWCVECGPGEAGEIIGKVATDDPKLNPLMMGVFDGYYGQKEATEKKLLRDAFVKGDLWLRMGDLMRMESDGYLYFVDRIGDTFRFKGENVSTTELGNTLALFPSVQEVNVYGAETPQGDGRAGAAAIVWKKEVTRENEGEVMRKLGAYCEREMAPYAIPRFIRIQEEIEITGTLKHRKVELQKDGVDPDKIKDRMWWWDVAKKCYEPYGHKEYVSLMAGKARL